jgi:uncharacterized protein (TIGR00725 family)
MPSRSSPYVAVLGPGEATEAEIAAAEAIGRGLAQAGAIVLTGGLGGVMAAASRGASSAGGLTIGILPGRDRTAANEWLSVAIPTGMGELRNGLVVRAVDAVVAVGGAYGTLSEVALALKTQVPVVGLWTWGIEGIESVESADGAVARVLQLALSAGPG